MVSPERNGGRARLREYSALRGMQAISKRGRLSSWDLVYALNMAVATHVVPTIDGEFLIERSNEIGAMSKVLVPRQQQVPPSSRCC